MMATACAFPFGERGAAALPLAALVVTKHLQDVTCSVGDDILMECEIEGPPPTSAILYRNGLSLRNKSRFRVLACRNIFRIEIKNIRETDQGCYCLIIQHGDIQVATKAFIFVPVVKTNEVAYYAINPYDCTRVTRHLCPVTVAPGEKIELMLLLETYVHVRHYWYKDAVEIDPHGRPKMENTDSMAHLVIDDAMISDSGIYCLVMATRDGILSSYANVNVIWGVDSEQLSKPSIINHLQPEISVLENQYTKLICRGMYDINTHVQWYMNDIMIDDIQVLQEDYGNGQIALKIFDTFPELSATYKVVLVNEETGCSDSSTCNLTVTPTIMARAPLTDIVKPLESAVASCGSKVLFDCVFSYDNHQKLRAIWYVGRYKVERSNRLFNVICKGGVFILYIKKMTIDMAGEVICEIHQWIHSPRAVHVTQSIANLTMVPPGFLDDSLGDISPKHFRKGTHAKHRGIMPVELLQFPVADIRQIISMKPIKFKFCLLDEHGSYYFFTKPRTDVKIYYNHPIRTGPRHKRNIGVFHWVNKTAPGAWYSIAFQTDEGSFMEIGITTKPMFEFQIPELDKMLIFQIRIIPPVACMFQPMPVFRRNQELEMKVPPERRVRQYCKFLQTYIRREEMIGGGAFGRVALVEDEYGDSYAAKVVKLNERMTQDVALREFFMLRRLLHHNVIGVIDAYTSNELVTITMDYAWGGDLLERIAHDPHINEVDIVPCVKQILQGLQYIHSQNMVHLDLKPENLVFAHPNSMTVKLVDFGLSRVLYEGSKIRAIYGTRDYVAPEVLLCEPVHVNSDMWSLGVCIFMMLSGTLPFEANTETDQMNKIITSDYTYDDPAFNNISESAKNFIDHLLTPPVRRRYRAKDAMKDPWIRSGPNLAYSTGDMTLARSRLKVHLEHYKAKWKRAAGVLLCVERLGLPVPVSHRPTRIHHAYY